MTPRWRERYDREQITDSHSNEGNIIDTCLWEWEWGLSHAAVVISFVGAVPPTLIDLIGIISHLAIRQFCVRSVVLVVRAFRCHIQFSSSPPLVHPVHAGHGALRLSSQEVCNSS